MTAHDGWEQVLHAYSAALDEHRAMLLVIEADDTATANLTAVPEFVPPRANTLIPSDLVPLATSLMDVTAGLVELARRLAVRAATLARPAARAWTSTAASTLDAQL